MQTYAYGFPRLGSNREYKKSIESYWKKKISKTQLIQEIKQIEHQRINTYKNYGVQFPLGEMTLYDNIFDCAFIFGVYRYRGSDLQSYFNLARGKNSLEMRKFFNTNYHYLVPVIKPSTRFHLQWNKPLYYFNNFKQETDNKSVYMVGPYTFLKLSRVERKSFLKKLDELMAVYKILFEKLSSSGVKKVHLDEPAFVMDLPAKEIQQIKKFYHKYFASLDISLDVFTYYSSVDFIRELKNFPVAGVGLDFVYGRENLSQLRKSGWDKNKKLYCGIINARNPRREEIFGKAALLRQLLKIKGISEDNLVISSSCPLFHLPISIENEKKASMFLKEKVSFAREKLHEIRLLSEICEGKSINEANKWSKNIIMDRDKHAVYKTESLLSLSANDIRKRHKAQESILNLPLFPTTTIGSFPQDEQVRKTRLLFRRKQISANEYQKFIREKIKELIRFQEDAGLDVLVHGEFERTDMVEFFAQQLDGMLTTNSGWVISYGTRVYRPPLIYKEAKRIIPLTIKEILFAQSLTKKPVKGMLTGPITILAWSYNISGLSAWKIAFSIARALNEEIKALIQRGIKIIQIDEPAFRELAPIKAKKRKTYFMWATRSFNVASHCPQNTQIHTHMCYSEFGEILDWIIKMNFDNITIEATRSKGRIVESFKGKSFIKQIGPGVWDIHSVCVPKIKDMMQILQKSLKVLEPCQIWINPDCGLKTRGWKEVVPSIKNMIKTARILRKKYK